VYKDNQGMVWFGTINGISRYNPTYDLGYKDPPKIHFSGLDLFYETIDWTTRTDSVLPFTGMPEYLKLKYTDNHLTFRFHGLYFTNPQKIRYQYMLEGREVDWSPSVTTEEVTYSGLLPGDYVFHVRSGIELEEWSGNPLRFAFTIKPPFYKTWWFILILVFLTLVAIASYIKYREKQLILEKKVLEEKVEERTREIRKQKNEIEEKNRYLSEANEEITLQKEIIEKKNIDITDSIIYAKRIQDAVLPSEKILKQYLVDSFILFKPKDIVSGDFYWVKEKEDLLIVVAADCTGHGVPGAFMSLLGITFLNEIVEKNNITSPEKILNQLRENVITSLKQKGLDSESKDGMDIAICTINRKTHKLEFSGANNPMYYIRNDRLIMVKADRMPVAIHARMKDFTKNEVSLIPGDTVYLFSDGYADQFGGPAGKKLKYKTFQDTLLEVQKESMASQKEILNKKHLEWRGSYEQIDDIVVLGFKVYRAEYSLAIIPLLRTRFQVRKDQISDQVSPSCCIALGPLKFKFQV
jgi:serine phosphatase RsbU (regulator of sigma subunit)